MFAIVVLTVLTCSALANVMEFVPSVHADCASNYCLSAGPNPTTEGSTVNLFLSVDAATPSTLYSFIFKVMNPGSVSFQSTPQNYTTGSFQTSFTMQIAFPFNGQASPGSTTLVGQYMASVDQLAPSAISSVATTTFNIILTDNTGYERTQTVSVQGAGYTSGESVNVTITNQITGATVFSHIVVATTAGTVTTSWKIPVNTIIDNYIVTLTGTLTTKTVPDTSQFSVTIAVMNIQSITSSKSSYQRTETMKFSFQAKYPDGTVATTGSGRLTLTDPVSTGGGVSLTTIFDPVAQTFNATFKTLPSNLTGSWTVSLPAFAYSDAYGNLGNWYPITSNVLLTVAPLNVNVSINTNFVVDHQSRFNVTITYPDGSVLQSGTVNAYLTYTGTPTINDTIPLVYDTGLRVWIGTYTPKPSDTGGLWSLTIKAIDPATPVNSGIATRAINLQNPTGSGQSIALYYYGIIGLLIGMILAFLVVFKRRKSAGNTHLKLDLDAIHSEAGRIQSGDFFQSVKDQLGRKTDDENT